MSSTKDTVASSTKTILTSSANWDDWNDRFVSQAIMYESLGHVQGKENLLPKAVKPAMAHYPQKARPTTFEAVPNRNRNTNPTAREFLRITQCLLDPNLERS
jgi:hypothetical protein